jgi:hypothetical protein
MTKLQVQVDLNLVFVLARHASMIGLACGTAMMLGREILGLEAALGRVDIHFSQIMAATRNSTAANDTTVFS